MDRNDVAKEIDELKEISTHLSNMSVDNDYHFLLEILTPTEISTLTKRWRILKMLKEGYSQREIAKELNVSLCKVTRGSKILKNTQSICSKLIK